MIQFRLRFAATAALLTLWLAPECLPMVSRTLGRLALSPAHAHPGHSRFALRHPVATADTAGAGAAIPSAGKTLGAANATSQSSAKVDRTILENAIAGPTQPPRATAAFESIVWDEETLLQLLATQSTRSTGWIAYAAAAAAGAQRTTISLEQTGDALDRAFAPFVERQEVSVRRDARYFYVESKGMPNHPMMVGIRAWQQQVPLPQPYQGDNAWRIPVKPVPAKEPAMAKDRFLRGAIALAVNGVPIFNPFNNRGEDAYLIGELDEYGGHCGRADDYHYHIAPVHLEKQLGKGAIIAYALDGYPIYGYTEPDGTKPVGLDALNGHQDAQGNYHYHASPTYPYLNGGFHGEVVEREGQVDPQPRAQGVREALTQLRGARIVGFFATQPNSYRLTYDIGGRQGKVEYTRNANGSVAFTYTEPNGQTRTELATPRRRGPGAKPEGQPERKPERKPERRPDGKPDRKPDQKPDQRPDPKRPDGKPERKPARKLESQGEQNPAGKPQDRPGPRSPDPRSGGTAPRGANGPSGNGTPMAPSALSANTFKVTMPGLAVGQKLPIDHTCDGAGVSPPVAWTAGPAGTKAYALCLWHRTPDALKSYWVVHDIPANVTELPKDSRAIGRLGVNDKRKTAYDPMCSKGPGPKTYHLTVYALSRAPELPAGGATRVQLLEAIQSITLAEGTLDFVYERGERAP